MSNRALLACLGAVAVAAGGALIAAWSSGTTGRGPDGVSAPRSAGEPGGAGPAMLDEPVAARSVAGERLDFRAPEGGASAIVFYSTECPIAAATLPTVAELRATIPPRDLLVVGVCVDPDRSADEVSRHAREHGLGFPVVHDRRGDLVRRFGVEIVPEAFVFSGAGRLRYRGRIDDQFTSRGRRNPSPGGNDLREAIEDELDGVPPGASYREPVGCPVPEYREATGVGPTFTEDVAPILQRSCQPCHRPGQSAPFALLTYEQAAKRSRDLAAVAEQGLMPPWPPTAGVGPALRNDRTLLPSEVAALREWAEAGAPEGPAGAMPGPAEFPDGWALGTPDLVLEMAEDFEVPATGSDIYRCFVLPTDLPEDAFITALEVRPGNPRVVHHTFGYIDVRGLARSRDRDDPGPGYGCFSGFSGDQIFGAIGGWTPGNEPHPFGDGVGLALPRGADVVVQVHYQTSGKPETDRTRLGLHLADGPIRQALQWISACADPDTFILPAGDPDIRIETRLTIPMDVELHAMTPHMHLLGRQFLAAVDLPDGRTLPLIQIDDWDFNQQDTYYLREPLRLPAGSVVRILGRYDNSSGNPQNPSRPPREVRWGEATTDDMLILFLALTEAGQDLTEPGARDAFMEDFFARAGAPPRGPSAR